MFLQRFLSSDLGILGILLGERREFLCFTLEIPFTDGLLGSAVAAGVYPIMLMWSSKWSGYMPYLDVPKRSGIMLHAGNTIRDSRGCILLGKGVSSSSPYMLMQSREAVSEVVHYIKSNHVSKIDISTI